MTPQIPGYLLSFELAFLPLVAAIALGPHLDGCRSNESASAVALHDCRCAVGGPHRLAGGRPVPWRGKYLFREHRDLRANPDVRFADPGDYRRHWPAAIGKRLKPCLRHTAALARGGSNLSRWGRHIPRALGGRTPALAIRAARRVWGRCDRLSCRRRRRAAGAKCGWRSQSGLCLVPFWNRRPCVAVTMGALTSPGPAHLFARAAPNLLISSYPLVMVPTFAVPMALMLHGLVLWRLRRETVSNARLAVA